MATITWTKNWTPSDDGTTLKAIDLRNIQDDVAAVLASTGSTSWNSSAGTTKTSNYTVLAADFGKTIILNNSGITLTLPDIAGSEILHIKNVHATASATLACDASDTLETTTLLAGFGYTILGDATANAWRVISSAAIPLDEDAMTSDSATRVPTQQSTKAYVDGKFNTSTGHDHDGSDSKKIPVGSIDATGTPSASTMLKGDGSWGAAPSPGLSFVSSASFTVSGPATSSNFSLNSAKRYLILLNGYSLNATIRFTTSSSMTLDLITASGYFMSKLWTSTSADGDSGQMYFLETMQAITSSGGTGRVVAKQDAGASTYFNLYIGGYNCVTTLTIYELATS